MINWLKHRYGDRFASDSRWLNTTLYLGYGFVMLLMATSLAITIQSTSSVKNHSQVLLQNEFPQTLGLMELEQLLNLSLSHLNEFLITQQETERVNFYNAIITLQEQIHSQLFTQHIEPVVLANLQQLFDQYRFQANAVIELSQNDSENYLGIAKASELLNPLHNEYIGGLDALIERRVTEAETLEQREVTNQLIKAHNSWINMIMSLRVYFTTQGKRDYGRVLLYQQQSIEDMQRLEVLTPELGFDSFFVDELQKVHHEYMENLPKILEIFENNTWRMDTFLTRTEIYPIANQLRERIGDLVNVQQIKTHKDTNALSLEMDSLTRISQIAFLVSLLVGFSVIVVVSRNISQIFSALDASRRDANERSDMLQVTSDDLAKSLEKLQSTQSQLVENEKMAALGNLVAGMSHEINTPIGIGVTASTHIEDNTSEIEKKFEQGTIKKSDFSEYIRDTRESNKIMLTNLRRAADLISSFKQVAVDQSSEELRQFELAEYLREIHNSLIPNLKKTNIGVSIECAETIYLHSYPGAIAQIITNLIMNSLVHGFEEGQEGAIDIVAERAESSTIFIVYQDNGKGMDSETLSQVFDPFFTTKRGQGGSGIGMHLIYNLVTQKLKGKIEINSNIGSGIIVKMSLPQELED